MHFTVLGAEGFIGSRLVARLRQRGYVVHAPARNDRDWLGHDLGHVFYCIGLTNDFHKRPFDTVEAHCSLLAQVLHEACFERLVYLSSTRLYDSLDGEIGDESAVLPLDPSCPRHLYDLSKALGESLCLNHSTGRACVARLSCVYSDTLSEGGFLAQVLPKAVRGESFTLESSPNSARDYVHVEDVVELLPTMLLGDASGIYNVSAGYNTSNKELVDALQRLTASQIIFSGMDAQHTPCASNEKVQRSFYFRPRHLIDHLPTMLESLKGSPYGA